MCPSQHGWVERQPVCALPSWSTQPSAVQRGSCQRGVTFVPKLGTGLLAPCGDLGVVQGSDRLRGEGLLSVLEHSHLMPTSGPLHLQPLTWTTVLQSRAQPACSPHLLRHSSTIPPEWPWPHPLLPRWVSAALSAPLSLLFKRCVIGWPSQLEGRWGQGPFASCMCVLSPGAVAAHSRCPAKSSGVKCQASQALLSPGVWWGAEETGKEKLLSFICSMD